MMAALFVGYFFIAAIFALISLIEEDAHVVLTFVASVFWLPLIALILFLTRSQSNSVTPIIMNEKNTAF